MTLLFLIALFAISCLVVAVSFVHLLCRESLRIQARELASLQFYRETLQEKLGLDAENGALAYSLVRHFGLLAMAIVTFAMMFNANHGMWRNALESFVITSFLMLLTSYVAPRFLYRHTTGQWSLALSPILRLLAVLSKPVIGMLDFFQSLADLGDKQSAEEQKPTAEEHIEALIEAGKEEGILEENDSRLIQSVVAFGDKKVREVMTPRPNIIAIEAGRTLEELRNIVINEQYSRIPVYEGTIDNLVGYVHVRDMFELDPEERAGKVVRTNMRPLRCVPESKPVHDLLREMQHDSVHMVGVVDEYGNTAGIATMEDLVEEIIGEVRDEHEPGVDAMPEANGAFVVAGSFDLDNLKQLIDFRPEDETESTTVGGLISEWLGHVPKIGESVEREGIRMEVLAGDDRRVERVRVQKALIGTK